MKYCGEPVAFACHVYGRRVAWFCKRHTEMAKEIVLVLGNVLIVEEFNMVYKSDEFCKVRVSDFELPDRAKPERRKR